MSEEICENCEYFFTYGKDRVCDWTAQFSTGQPKTLTRKKACKEFKLKKEGCGKVYEYKGKSGQQMIGICGKEDWICPECSGDKNEKNG